MLIHDVQKNPDKKLTLFAHYDFKLPYSFKLSDKIWWESYYKLLDAKIQKTENEEILMLLEPDIEEIKLFKRDSSEFCSVYCATV